MACLLRPSLLTQLCHTLSHLQFLSAIIGHDQSSAIGGSIIVGLVFFYIPVYKLHTSIYAEPIPDTSIPGMFLYIRVFAKSRLPFGLQERNFLE